MILRRKSDFGWVSLSSFLEKFRQQSEAFVMHHSGVGFRLGMQHVAETRESVFWVVGSPYDLADMGVA